MLPPQYDDPAYAGKKFPVLVAYPGGAGASGAVWFSHDAPEALTDGVKNGTSSPFVVVEPQMQLTEGLDTECTDLDGQPKVGTFLDTDVPDLIKASFDVIDDRTGWATTGVSSGGYCAAEVAMRRPDVFAVAAPIDAYFVIDANVASGHTKAAKATSPIALAAPSAPPITMRGWYGTGYNNGQLSKQRSQEFAAAVRPPTVYTQREIPGGAHSWTTYHKLLPEVVTWLSGVVAKPQDG